MDEHTFHPKFLSFEVAGPGEEMIYLCHRFQIPPLDMGALGRMVYDKPPWRIYRDDTGWTYLSVLKKEGTVNVYQVARFNTDHTEGVIYHHREDFFRRGESASLSFLPTDQIILSRALAKRHAFYFHAAGVVLNGKGFLFAGRSGAGKSTAVGLLGDEATILCDDRIIVRQKTQSFQIHGTWSHGDIPAVSSTSAPLNAFFFIRKAKKNRLFPVSTRKEAMHLLLDCLVRPVEDAEWWNMTLDFVEELAAQSPCYVLEFVPQPGLDAFIEHAGL